MVKPAAKEASTHAKFRDDAEFLAKLEAGTDEWIRKWDPLHNQDVPSILYHYTDAAGIVGIVEKGELWASDALFVNDSTELVYIRGVLADVLAELNRTYAHDRVVIATLDGVERAVWGFVSELFDVYVSCFCEDGDLLSQWRGYPSAGGGYAIGFRPGALSGMAMLRRVIYDEEAQRDLLRALIDSLCRAMEGIPVTDLEHYLELASAKHLAHIGTALVECSFCFKHRKFREEAEWRLVRLRVRDPDVMPSEEELHPWPKLRPTRTGLLPYVIVKLARDADGNEPISEVVVGPGSHPELATKAAAQLLGSAGYPDPAKLVMRSAIPLRA